MTKKLSADELIRREIERFSLNPNSTKHTFNQPHKPKFEPKKIAHITKETGILNIKPKFTRQNELGKNSRQFESIAYNPEQSGNNSKCKPFVFGLNRYQKKRMMEDQKKPLNRIKRFFKSVI